MPDLGQPYWALVEEIFHRALTVSIERRADLVRASCGGDAQLERDVHEILSGYEEQCRLSKLPDPSTATVRFGAFEIVRKIGEGGMGTVYLGRRYEDFEQSAAIKLIHGTPAAVALMAGRFRQERQILAVLEHPNIARLLDGGVSPDGQPYLAMEYVEGVRLDRYCGEQGLSIRARLVLFRKVCGAVHFAHQHLVVHRDLKPSNILVDANGEPKLLDFGIAKILSTDSGSRENATTVAGLMMTPQFASPEQLQGLPCAVASDVYSLGVILYELLAGKGPYSDAATPAELMAAVVTADPPRPSRQVAESDRTALRGDLDSIVLKALAKKPGQRYGSVEQLSEDIGRHLEGLPVSAMASTRLYVAGKFVGRHRASVSAAALVLLSLITGMAATLWQARVAERQRALAEQRFSDARKLANYLLFPLYDSVQALQGSLPVRADLASQALLYLDRLGAARSADRALNLELAEGYLRLGGILESPYGYGESLGNAKRAMDSDRKALALLGPLIQATPADPRVQQDLARANLNLGKVLNMNGQSDQAVVATKQATAMFDRLAASSPSDASRQVEAGRAYGAMMDVLGGRGGGLSEAAAKENVLATADKAITHLNAALGLSPSDAGALEALAYVYQSKGLTEYNTANFKEAIATYQKSLDCLRRLSPGARDAADNQGVEGKAETMIGAAYGELTKYSEALTILKSAQQVLDRVAAADPNNATSAYRRMNLYRSRGYVNVNAGHLQDAIADYRVTVEILDRMISVDPSKTSYRVIRAETQQKMAKLLADSGQLAEATRYAKAGVAYLDEVADRPDALPQNLNEAAYAHMEPPIPSLADYPRAVRYAQRADQLSHGKSPIAVFYLAQAYENSLDGPRALESIQRFGALLPPTPAGQKPSRARAIYEKHLRQIQYLIKTGHLPAAGLETPGARH